jgi:sugar lactone lactonase YvrE
VALSTPWDVLFSDGFLYIANAGTHQIWVLDTSTGILGPLIGSAREGTVNGAFEAAELAQPSGLALDDDNRLFFADSESSSIRAGDLATGTTSLIVGGDASLFEFGDADGIGNEARLQHPLGIAVAGNTLYVADTYNSKIKRVDPTTREVETVYGGTQGWADGIDAQFYEPGGLGLHESTLYVADTNNHAIRSIDLTTGIVSTLVLSGIERFRPLAGSPDFQGETVVLDAVTLGTGVGTITIDLDLPAGYKVNEQAPSSVVITVDGPAISITEEVREVDITGAAFPIHIPAEFFTGSADVQADVTLIYCRDEAESLCFIQQLRLLRSAEGKPTGGAPDLLLTHRVEVRSDL